MKQFMTLSLLLMCRYSLADDFEIQLNRAEQLADSLRNSDVQLYAKSKVWPHTFKGTAAEFVWMSNQINEKFDNLEYAKQRTDRERLITARKQYDLIVLIQRRELGKVLLDQMKHKDRWIASHILLVDFFRLRTAWTENLEVGAGYSAGYTHYWNGLLVEERYIKTESGIRQEITIPHPEEQRKYLLKHWTTLLTMKVPVEK